MTFTSLVRHILEYDVAFLDPYPVGQVNLLQREHEVAARFVAMGSPKMNWQKWDSLKAREKKR